MQSKRNKKMNNKQIIINKNLDFVFSISSIIILSIISGVTFFFFIKTPTGNYYNNLYLIPMIIVFLFMLNISLGGLKLEMHKQKN